VNILLFNLRHFRGTLVIIITDEVLVIWSSHKGVIGIDPPHGSGFLGSRHSHPAMSLMNLLSISNHRVAVNIIVLFDS